MTLPMYEVWEIGPDNAIALGPPEVAGHARPGARELLKRPYPGQRRTQGPREDALGRAMTRGHFPIGWDLLAIVGGWEDGLLANSFHRLKACVRFDVRYQTGVMLNTSPEAVDVGDRGFARSLKHRLERMGVPEPFHAQTAYRYLTKITMFNTPSYKGAIGDDDVIVTYEAHPDLAQHMAQAKRLATYRLDDHGALKRPTGGNLGSTGLGALMAYLLHLADSTKAQSFFTCWESDITSSAQDPVRHLLNWCDKQHTPGSKGSTADSHLKYGMVVEAFNAWPDPITRLTTVRTSPLPRIVVADDRDPEDMIDLAPLFMRREQREPERSLAE